MLGRICLVGLLMTGPACGSSPSAPAAQFPNLIGAWSGTLNINSGTNICSYTWSITSQTGGSFFGSYQAAGTCRLSNGEVSGTVTEAGAFSIGALLPLENVCTRLAGGTTTGMVSGTTVSAMSSESQRCNTPTGPFEFTRTYVLSLTKS